MILTALQKLPKNGEDWGKLIIAKGFKKLPKVQNITQSGHTALTPSHTTVTVSFESRRPRSLVSKNGDFADMAKMK